MNDETSVCRKCLDRFKSIGYLCCSSCYEDFENEDSEPFYEDQEYV